MWDYPRPPRVEATSKRIRVVLNGETLADTTRALRVLETSHPPVYYLPPEAVRLEFFTPTSHHTTCEFKGAASYWTITVGERQVTNGAWSYPNPAPGFEALRGYMAVYPGKMDACYVDDELVQPQAGDFYGGWITSDIVGPFKGGPGTRGW
ncbi:MAG TPA: DUF427 domain-containing protein [Phototrophicaceae bacterium]|nr:DUF427 domain-containing protein [Phototrophicaceae bacterium]